MWRLVQPRDSAGRSRLSRITASRALPSVGQVRRGLVRHVLHLGPGDPDGGPADGAGRPLLGGELLCGEPVADRMWADQVEGFRVDLPVAHSVPSLMTSLAS